MEVVAKVKYLRISPRKVRLVLDAVRGLQVDDALNRLTVMNKKAAKTVTKLINSAIANAENNFKLKKEDLIVKTITADEGPTLKRWRSRAFGRAAVIRKRTSHLLVILTDGKEEKPEVETNKKIDKPKEETKDKKSSLEIIEKDTKKDKGKSESKDKKAKIKKDDKKEVKTNK